MWAHMKAGEKLNLFVQIFVYQFTFFKGKSYPNDEAGGCYGLGQESVTSVKCREIKGKR